MYSKWHGRDRCPLHSRAAAVVAVGKEILYTYIYIYTCSDRNAEVHTTIPSSRRELNRTSENERTEIHLQNDSATCEETGAGSEGPEDSEGTFRVQGSEKHPKDQGHRDEATYRESTG